MKSGCNFADRNKIKSYVQSCLDKDEDVDIEHISRVLLIQPGPVANWVDHFLDELDPQPEKAEPEEVPEVAEEVNDGDSEQYED